MKFNSFTFGCLFLLSLIVGTFAANAQSVAVSIGNVTTDCSAPTPQLCFSLFGANPTAFNSLAWNLYLTYDPAVVTIANAGITVNPAFNDNANNFGTIDATVAGITQAGSYNATGSGFISVGTTPVLLATYCFTIVNPAGNPNFAFDPGPGNTGFTSDLFAEFNVPNSNLSLPTMPTSINCGGACTGVTIAPGATATATTCGSNNGSISTNPSGGAAPYTTSVQGGSAGSLAAGTYGVTVTDSNGCSATTTVNVAASQNISASASATNSSCSGSTGSVSVSVQSNGNSGAITYTWSGPTAVGNTANGTNLAPGTYTIQVAQGGCTTSTTATVGTASGPVLSLVSAAPATCGNSNGAIVVSSTGGTGTVTYNLGGGLTNTTGSFSGLSGGSYAVTATDGGGCSATLPINVANQPGPAITNLAITNTSCGANNGAAVATVAGGTGTISYAWTGSTSANNQASNLPSGAISVTVTDANGCTASQSGNVGASTGVSISSATSTATTCGLSNGTVSISATGSGTLSYAVAGQTNASGNFSGVASGNYTATVTAGSCSATTTVSVGASSGISATASSTQTACGSSTGSVSVAPSGGGTFSFQWSANAGSATTATVSNLGTGTYVVTVTQDGTGCTFVTQTTVSTAGGPTASAGTVTATCGGSNGSVTVTATGNGPFTYSLNGGTGQSSNVFSGLAAGSYNILVTDNNGCSTNISATVGNVAGPSNATASTTQATPGNADGSITVSVSGGTAPLQYNIGSGNQSSNTFNGLAAGSYSVTVTDANGCSAVASATVTETTAICTLNAAGQCTLHLGNNGGGAGGGNIIQVPVGASIEIEYSVAAQAGEAGYVAGFYILNPDGSVLAFVQANGSILGAITSIVNPTNPFVAGVVYSVQPVVVLAADPLNTLATCHKAGPIAIDQFVFMAGGCESVVIDVAVPAYDCNTGFQATATGGVGPYSFSPSLGTSLDNGSYTVIATDANGCQGSTDFTVTNATISGFAVYDCLSGLHYTVISGPVGVSYTYSPVEGTMITTPGSYTGTITASNGCSASFSFGVGDCNCAAANIVGASTYSCTTGFSLSATGGLAPYTYSIGSNVLTVGETLTNGSYTINIVDANGCSGNQAITIACSSDPCAGVSIGVTASYTCATGLAISASGGTGTYTFSPAVGTFLPQGSATITATDANGCSGTATISVPSCGCTNPPSAATVAPSSALCNQNGEGGATSLNLASLVTGTAGGTWSGSSAISGNTFNALGLASGNYPVTYTVSSPGCPNASSTQVIVVHDCNPGPTAVDNESQLSPNTTSFCFNVLNNDSNDAILVGVSNPSNACVTLESFTADGEICISLAPCAEGTVINIGYTIEDEVGQSAAATWTINITECQANAGTLQLVGASNVYYCSDASIQVSAPGYNTNSSFTQLYVLVKDGQIVALSNNGLFASPAVSGDYTVQAVNYADGTLSLSVGDSWPASGSCSDLSNAVNITILKPLGLCWMAECLDETDDFYVVTMYISGGFPEYSGFGSYTTNFEPVVGDVVWNPSLVVPDDATCSDGGSTGHVGAGSFVLHVPKTVMGFNLSVQSDGYLCEYSWYVTVGIPDCPEPPLCNPLPGVMDSEVEYVCYGDAAYVNNIGGITQDYNADGVDDEIFSFVLWNPADSSQVYVSQDGVFTDITPIILADGCNGPITWAAAMAVGPDNNGDGYVDWDDECTKFTNNAQPVTFLCPIDVNVEVICNFDTGEFQLVVTATGGIAPYQLVNGNVAGEFEGSIILGPYTADNTVTFQVQDANGCLSNVVTETEDCKVTPINLLGFTGEVLETGNMLRWTTASETENDFFTLMRSVDGSTFEPAGTVDGAGNSIIAINYEFLDKNAPVGLSYYRLDQTDFDGTTTSSEVITLQRGEVSFGFIGVSPIPAVNTLSIDFTSANDIMVSMSVYDASGKLVLAQEVEATHGLNTTSIDVTDYASGVYFLMVNNGQETLTTRFVKQ